jgi:hypothetical protein
MRVQRLRCSSLSHAPACAVSLIPRMFGKKTVVTVQGLDWQRGSGDGCRGRFWNWVSGPRQDFPIRPSLFCERSRWCEMTGLRPQSSKQKRTVRKGGCVASSPYPARPAAHALSQISSSRSHGSSFAVKCRRKGASYVSFNPRIDSRLRQTSRMISTT